MKRALNDFAAFDSKPGEKVWRFRLKSDPVDVWRWQETAPDWYSARQQASARVGCEPSQLIGEQVT